MIGMRTDNAEALRGLMAGLADRRDLVRETVLAARAIPPDWQPGPPAQGLIRLRRRLRLTQAALAERAGIPQSFISKVERGRDVRLSTLCRLYEAMGYQAVIVPLGPEIPGRDYSSVPDTD